MRVVDIEKLDRYREQVDEYVVRIAIEENVSRWHARNRLANHLGFELITLEFDDSWLSSFLSHAEYWRYDQALQAEDDSLDHDSFVFATILAERTYQACSREDAESAAILTMLDDKIDVLAVSSHAKRCFPRAFPLQEDEMWHQWLDAFCAMKDDAVCQP